ncbi:hypothetical protein ACFUYE_03810 [Micromonospora humida]|uniref:hypothetical protein n=1 Tax=Micromonospora humida TaxID=2809018 RepID=UPI003671174D
MLQRIARLCAVGVRVCEHAGELHRGLEAITEAVNIYEPLAEQLPAVFAERLFAAQTLARVLDGLAGPTMPQNCGGSSMRLPVAARIQGDGCLQGRS